jgi:nucleoside-diphosphate-sugar epimerase
MSMSSPKVLVTGGCGYVGSTLCRHLERQGFTVTSVDVEIFGNVSNPASRRIDYRELAADELNAHDAVVHLAGHSSVKMANGDPGAALDNNINGFFRLLQKLDGTKLIYASSASVYSGLGGEPASEDHVSFTVANVYDFTKHGGDCLAALYGREYYALRFGTVNGISPNLRTDLIINSMVKSALIKGAVSVFNPQVHRSILVLGDLVRAVETIVKGPVAPGIYNLASFSATVGEIATEIGRILGVPLAYGDASPTYDFVLDTRKFQRVFDFTFRETIESVVSDLVAHKDQLLATDRGRG